MTTTSKTRKLKPGDTLPLDDLTEEQREGISRVLRRMGEAYARKLRRERKPVSDETREDRPSVAS